MIEELHELDKRNLEAYYNRLLKTTAHYKYLQFTFLWNFLHTNSTYSQLCQTIREKAGQRFHHLADVIGYKAQWAVLPVDLDDQVCLIYTTLEVINRSGGTSEKIFHRIGKAFWRGNPGADDEYFNLFNDLFLEPFILYLLHHANKNIIILNLLKKYKQKTEWFNRERLNEIAKNNSSTLEKKLTLDLYSYLFDNGLDFYIEPVSPSGELDLIAAQKNSPVKALIEGKVFDAANRPKRNIINGFHQLLIYIKDYNENRGYLVIFNTTDKVLSFNFGTSPEGFPLHSIDNKSIYFIIIDIFLHPQSASVRGKADRIEINTSDLN